MRVFLFGLLCMILTIVDCQVQRAICYVLFFFLLLIICIDRCLYAFLSISSSLEKEKVKCSRSLLIIISRIYWYNANANSNCYNCLINFYCFCIINNIMVKLEIIICHGTIFSLHSFIHSSFFFWSCFFFRCYFMQ